MGLFGYRCRYCRARIDKGREVFRDVRDPAFVGLKSRTFCCENHADLYEQESKKSKKCGTDCCG